MRNHRGKFAVWKHGYGKCPRIGRTGARVDVARFNTRKKIQSNLTLGNSSDSCHLYIWISVVPSSCVENIIRKNKLSLAHTK